MAKTVITASTNDATELFVIDGLEYKKQEYIIESLVVDNQALDGVENYVGLRNKHTGEVIVFPKRPSDWNNGTIDYADYDAAVAGISSLIY